MHALGLGFAAAYHNSNDFNRFCGMLHVLAWTWSQHSVKSICVFSWI